MFDDNNNSYSWTCYLQQWSIQLLDTRYIIALCQLPRVCVRACVRACVRSWPANLFKVTYLALHSKRLPTPGIRQRPSVRPTRPHPTEGVDASELARRAPPPAPPSAPPLFACLLFSLPQFFSSSYFRKLVVSRCFSVIAIVSWS